MENVEGIYKRAPDVVAASMGDTALLLHVNDWVYLELNESGSRIWALLEDGRGIQQLGPVSHPLRRAGLERPALRFYLGITHAECPVTGTSTWRLLP